MIPVQDFKFVSLALASTATNATATANIDTKGFRYLTVIVNLDTQASTTSNPSVLKLSQSDDTVVTNFADVTGFVGDTSFTIADAETTKTTYHAAVLHMDLEGKKRYVRFACTPAGAAQIVGASAILSQADVGASTAALSGALVRVIA